MGDYRTARPEEIWKKIRDGEITEPTAGMCGGYAQANLVILPKKYAEDFKKFAERNETVSDPRDHGRLPAGS